MDKELVLAKLERLRRCVERVEAKTPPSADILKKDVDRQDIIAVNLERAIQQCADIGMHILSQRGEALPGSMAAVFAELCDRGFLQKETAEQLAKTVGFRNTAVHAYQKINWEIVFSICTKNLDVFREFAAQITHALA